MQLLFGISNPLKVYLKKEEKSTIFVQFVTN